ncbi:hypothetical protein Forpi1262_v017181 [Fusarium oxysporum f. sp. raphani]|uniref:Uncharacterized protein n=1 Tax=Fusarium oxysporum f. sp. raphani TaxID=96318 RepID=A0A8J5TUI3_FUSOX|nr:hypothetical protein Forpi1262_v017181 [Fusarium oxysporum f. sp. raphani]
MIATSPNNTSSEPTELIAEDGMLAKNVGSLSGYQLCLLSKLFAIRVASKNQALDFGYYMQRMENLDPQCYLEFIREELHGHMDIRPISDSGNNYLENLAHDAPLFERILTCKEAKTTPVTYTDQGSCDVSDKILLHRFVEIFRQTLQPTNILEDYKEAALAMASLHYPFQTSHSDTCASRARCDKSASASASAVQYGSPTRHFWC